MLHRGRRKSKREVRIVAIVRISPYQQCREFSRKQMQKPEGDFLHQRCGESVTPHIKERGVGEYPCQQDVELATPRIICIGESIFDYKYLRKFESKIQKGNGNCALDQCWNHLYIKNLKTHLMGMSLSTQSISPLHVAEQKEKSFRGILRS